MIERFSLFLLSGGAEKEMPIKAEADVEEAIQPALPRLDEISAADRNPSPGAVMDCGLYLPGLRHGGKALVVAELSLLDEQEAVVTAADLTKLLAHYRSSLVPRKSASKNGFILLVVGRPEESPKAFQLIQQLVHHVDNVGDNSL